MAEMSSIAMESFYNPVYPTWSHDNAINFDTSIIDKGSFSDIYGNNSYLFPGQYNILLNKNSSLIYMFYSFVIFHIYNVYLEFRIFIAS